MIYTHAKYKYTAIKIISEIMEMVLNKKIFLFDDILLLAHMYSVAAAEFATATAPKAMTNTVVTTLIKP